MYNKPAPPSTGLHAFCPASYTCSRALFQGMATTPNASQAHPKMAINPHKYRQQEQIQAESHQPGEESSEEGKVSRRSIHPLFQVKSQIGFPVCATLSGQSPRQTRPHLLPFWTHEIFKHNTLLAPFLYSNEVPHVNKKILTPSHIKAKTAPANASLTACKQRRKLTPIPPKKKPLLPCGKSGFKPVSLRNEILIRW